MRPKCQKSRDTGGCRPLRVPSAPMRVLVVTNFVPDAARAAARPLGPRPDRRDPPPRDRGRGLRLPARRRPVRPGDAAPARPAAPRALRPRPRPLRPGRLVRAARRRPPAGRHLPRHRRAPRGRRTALSAASPGAPTSSPPSRAPSSRPRTAGPACRRSPAPRSSPAAPTSAASARSRAPSARRELGLDPGGPLPALPRQPGAPREAPRPRRRAGGGDRRRAADRRLDRARRDAALDQRRQRGPRHLRLRGLRHGCVEALACDVPVLSTPVGVAPYALAGIAGLPLRPLRRRRPGAPPPAPTSTPTDPRVDGAARAATLVRGAGWPSGRSRPTATLLRRQRVID